MIASLMCVRNKFELLLTFRLAIDKHEVIQIRIQSTNGNSCSVALFYAVILLPLLGLTVGNATCCLYAVVGSMVRACAACYKRKYI